MLKKLNSSAATESEHYAFLNEGEYPQKYSSDFLLSRYWEIDRDTYWYFLEMMPPLDWKAGAFLVCEEVSNGIYSGYFEIAEKFYFANVDRKDGMSIIRRMQEIIAAELLNVRDKMEREGE